ncbi:MAG: hypothetical protein BMS9Abin05_2132 [Rhodothermia bacterium]|nr:MAG: hypothetical protein BMS9Abin05_2132 [Rhodothermia bacterium]
MGNKLYSELIESLEEVLAVERGEREAASETYYRGYIRVLEKENGETVWTLKEAAVELRKTDLSVYKTAADLLKAVRSILWQSQRGMAELLGIPKATYVNWEQGRVQPRGPSVSLIKMVINNPYELMKASVSTRKLTALGN